MLVQPSRLPLEICELVIDVVANFWDHLDFLSQPRRTTLRSCTLTCRSWLPRCRYHLFYTSDLLQNAEHLSCYVRMLRAHPDLTSLVRRLRISGSFDDGKAHWINALPIYLSPLLANLNHVIFTAQVSGLLAPYHPLFFQSLSLFTSVTELHYTCHARQPFINFARFVLAFPNLRTLHVDGESVWEKHDSVTFLTGVYRRRRRRLPLHHLHLSPYLLQRNLVNIVDFVRQGADPSLLRVLEVWDVRWRDGDEESVRAVGNIVYASQNLRSALLHITLLGTRVSELGCITFRNNAQLRSLELQINYLPESFNLFCEILSSIVSPHLHHLTLRFNAGAKDVEDFIAAGSIAVNHIDETLAHPRLASLQILSTDLPEAYWPQFFRRLFGRGDVHFQSVDRMESETLHELVHHVR